MSSAEEFKERYTAAGLFYNYYEFLGIRPGTDPKTITRAMTRMIVSLHPDRCRRPDATWATAILNNLKTIHSDITKRTTWHEKWNTELKAFWRANPNGTAAFDPKGDAPAFGYVDDNNDESRPAPPNGPSRPAPPTGRPAPPTGRPAPSATRPTPA
ncbi:hypothetical protein MMC19_007765, partial [Ptychographa xylographoides]|nr:hypothetical protein [Ptychographa xylographoides]